VSEQEDNDSNEVLWEIFLQVVITIQVNAMFLIVGLFFRNRCASASYDRPKSCTHFSSQL